MENQMEPKGFAHKFTDEDPNLILFHPEAAASPELMDYVQNKYNKDPNNPDIDWHVAMGDDEAHGFTVNNPELRNDPMLAQLINAHPTVNHYDDDPEGYKGPVK